MFEAAPFFANVAAASPHVQFVYDLAAGRVVFVNAAYERVLGGRPDQVNDELPGLLQRIHPDDRAYLAHYWRLWQRGRARDEVEIRLQMAGEPDQWFCLTPYYEATAGGGALLGGTLRDTSVLKRYQENADRFNSRKNATLEILSHDLSGAFIMVQQIVQYLGEEVPVPAGSRVPEMLRVLEETSRESVKLIRDFVSLEFLAAAGTDLKRSRVDAGAVLREPLDQLQRAQALLGHRVEYALPAAPVYAALDVNKFTQVLINLVANAVKFTPDGGTVWVSVDAGPDGVRVQVRDEGIGIPADLQPHLFERFTKARRPGLRGEPSTGLGLALCKTIVEWHGGTLSFTSAEGQGSTFTATVPQVR
ncbi:ATP-binding protein [Hymenobacter caeli]|uniref:sensor histidine kinase n=1 Tax=Hymenobacter caeli TaxID=2735894 RepID=UPI00293BCAF6|nr:ATP-binding protein [Hymenobacter caeli]